MQSIISGWIGRGGDHEPNAGFKVTHPSNGVYVVEFLKPFLSRPSVVATQQYAVRNLAWDDFENPGGSTLDNVVVIAVNENRVKLVTGNSEGIPTSRNFMFIAIGI